MPPNEPTQPGAGATAEKPTSLLAKWDQSLVRMMRQIHFVGRRRLRPGLRTIGGLALMAGGVLGFLPVLGFWMFPLGVFLVILDIPGTQRTLTRWLYRQRQRHR